MSLKYLNKVLAPGTVNTWPLDKGLMREKLGNITGDIKFGPVNLR